jgi:quinol monooxygenase YgiN
MLRFQLRIEFVPHAADEAVQVLRSLVGPVRAEPGCSATRLLRNLDDGSVTFVEEWRSGENLQQHLHAATFRTILAVMDLAAAAPTVEIDEISSRRGFEMVEELLGESRMDGTRVGNT